MTLKDLQIIHEAMVDLMDFAHGNCDGDESGIYNDMSEKYSEAKEILDKEKYKLYLRNALAKAKRKRK